MVMTLLGKSLDNILEKRCINVISMKRIAYQIVVKLKKIHEKGYVHRDLKPENILIGNAENPHEMFLVDFGLASLFKKTATEARKMYIGEIGTLKFCALASHLLFEQFPKDDLESLGYVLIFLVNKKVPWSNISS